MRTQKRLQQIVPQGVRPPIIRTPEKSAMDSSTRNKASYEKDIKASRTWKRQRNVVLCACSLNYLCLLKVLFEAT